MPAQGDQTAAVGNEALLLNVVEQLSRPLLQLRSMAELAATDPALVAEQWQAVRLLADTGLQLAESYALNLRLHGKLTLLELEPVAVSALLYDTAHALEPYAKQHGVSLELETGPRVAPVLADRTVLQAALTSLGQVFIESSSQQETAAAVRLSAHRSRYGMVTGLYTDAAASLGAESLRQARQLQAKARQPLQRLVSGPAAGVFVADALLQNLASRLHVARYHKLTGLAATLTPSAQLQLI